MDALHDDGSRNSRLNPPRSSSRVCGTALSVANKTCIYSSQGNLHLLQPGKPILSNPPWHQLLAPQPVGFQAKVPASMHPPQTNDPVVTNIQQQSTNQVQTQARQEQLITQTGEADQPWPRARATPTPRHGDPPCPRSKIAPDSSVRGGALKVWRGASRELDPILVHVPGLPSSHSMLPPRAASSSSPGAVSSRWTPTEGALALGSHPAHDDAVVQQLQKSSELTQRDRRHHGFVFPEART